MPELPDVTRYVEHRERTVMGHAPVTVRVYPPSCGAPSVTWTLTDPRRLSGIGNAYSDEMLHAAHRSPQVLTSRFRDGEIERLRGAMGATRRRGRTDDGRGVGAISPSMRSWQTDSAARRAPEPGRPAFHRQYVLD